MAKFWKTERHEDTTEKRQLTQDDIKFLLNLQKELNTQDYLSQADPRYWVIRDYQKVYGDKLNNPDGICLYDPEACETLYEDECYSLYDNEERQNEIIKLLKDTGRYSEELEEKIREADYITDLESEFSDLGINMMEYEEYPVDKGMFLTHEAAIQHLKSNDYHYSGKAHTYAHTAWRSQEEKLWNILQTIDWAKLPIQDKE